MPYTIWSRGHLVGETNLDHTRVDPRQRSGDFLPTAFGETLIPPPEPDENLPADIHVTSSLFEELELRAPDGTFIPAQWIEIRVPRTPARSSVPAKVRSTTSRT